MPPRTEAELLDRAYALAGMTLTELAAAARVPVPADARRAKGWAGQLLERQLGATSAGKAEVDFPGLGIELKSIPVDPAGRPTESTYVCVAPLDMGALGTWESCWVRKKLLHVLWIPLVDLAGPARRPSSRDRVDTRGPLERSVGARVVGSPVMWSPTLEEERALRSDWEEIADIVAHGELWRLDGRMGQVLQVRPKAADGAEKCWTQDEDGWVRDTPRGFYLRPAFTGALLARELGLRG
jgi:DNA mismatch repair protein MutH